MDDDACVLVRVGSGLGCHGVELVAHGLSNVDVTVLEDGGGVAEDKV